MAEELLNDSFSLQADQQVGPNPGPQPFSYETLFNSLNKGKGVTLPDGKVAKNAAELRDNLSIPKNAPEATPAYNEAVERQKAFFDVYQEPIKSFGILRNTEFSGVLQGQPRDFEKTAIKQKQEVSKILPPTSVVEKTPVANIIKQRVDNQVSAMQKAFDGVSNDQIEEMVYKAEVLGDDSASVIVKDKIVVPRLVYGELEEQEIGTPVEGGYQITYSDYKTYLKDVLGMRGEESRYDLPETERFLYESEELGASEPVNEIAQNTMNLKEMFIDKKASQKLEQNLIENSDYLSVLDTRSKSLLSEDEKKIADKTESIEKEVNDLFSEAFLSKYSSKEEATKAIQEKRDRIKILEAEAAQMRKGAGLAPNQLFNPISGKLEDATPEEKQNLELGIQSATAKYFGGGTQTPLTRSSMINDRNLLWNKLDYLDEEIKNTEAEARRLGFSLSKVGALQQTTGLRNATEIQKVKSLEKRFNNLLNERATNYGSLLTLNRAIYTNEDVFKKQSDALLRLAESLSEDLYVVNIFTDKNTVRSRVQQVNEMADYFNSKGVQLTPSQIAATEETLSESVSGSPGSLINLMVDVGLTSGLIGGVAKLATTNKYYDAAKLYMTTRAGRAGKFGVSLFERSLPTILQGAAFELADQSFTTGIAESISERGFDRFVGKGLEKFSGKYGKLTYSLGRWLSGISGEFLAEVSGEVANIMTENGYDLVGAFEDAYGKDVDQVTKSMAQLGLTVAFMAAPQNFGYLMMTDKKFREHIAEFGTNPVLEEVHMLIKNTIESTPRTAAGNKLGEQLYKNTPVDPLVFTPAEQGPELERLNVEQRAANNGEEFYLVENNGEVNTDVVYKVDATTGELMVKGFNPLVEGFTKASETLVNKVNEQSTTNGIISSDKATDIAARNLNVNKVTTKDGKVLYQAPGQSVEQFNQNRTNNINSTKTLAENRFAPFRELAKSIMRTIFPNVRAEVSDQQASVYNSYRDKVRGVLKLNAGSFFADGVAVLMESGMNKVPKIADFVAPLLEAFSKTGRVIRVAEEGSTETSRSVSLNSVLDSIVDSEFFQERFGNTADALNHAKTLLSDLLLNDKAIIESVLKDSTKVKDFLKFRENFNKFVAKNYTGAASYTSNQSFYRNQMPDTLIKSREEEFEMTKKEQLSERDKRNDIGRVLSAAGIPVNAKNIESVRYLNGDISAQQLLDAADVDTTGMSEADMQARANAEARDVDIRKFGEAVKNRKENEKRRKQNIKTLTNALSTKFGMNLFQSFKDSGLLNGLDVFSKRRTVARIMNRIIESAATREGVTAEQFLNDMLEFEKMKEEEFNKLYETNPNAKVYFQRIGEIGAQTNIEIQQNLDLAKRLEKEGKTEQEILESTGWFRAADGSFKYNYIQPRNTLNENIMKKLSEVTDFDSKLIPLQQVFSQGELFSIYPDLKDISVIFYSDADSKSIGDFDPISKDISVNLANAYSLFALERILSHEVQHAIQKIEGWQGGGQPEEFVDSKFEDINSYVDELVVSFKETGKVPVDLNPMVVLAAKSFITGGKDGLFTSTVKQASEVSKVFNSLISKELTKEEAVQQLSPYTTLSESELSKVLDNVAEINPDYQHILTILDAINENSIYESLYGEREARGVENLSDVRLRMSLLQRFLNSLPKSDSYSEISNRINNLFSRYTQFLSDGKKAIEEMNKVGLSELEISHLNGIFVDDTFNKLANLPFSVYAISKKPILKSTKELVDSIITIKQDLAKEYYSILNDSVDLIKPSLISLTDNQLLNGEAPIFRVPFTREPISRKKFDSDYNSYIKERNSVLEGQKIIQEGQTQGVRSKARVDEVEVTAKALEPLVDKVNTDILNLDERMKINELRQIIKNIKSVLSEVKDIKTFKDYIDFFVSKAIRDKNGKSGLLLAYKNLIGDFNGVEKIFDEYTEDLDVSNVVKEWKFPRLATDVQIFGTVIAKAGIVITKEILEKIKNTGMDSVTVFRNNFSMDSKISDDDLFELTANIGNIIKNSKNKVTEIISEAYRKAKADGSNPELVKAVEELLGVTQEGQTQEQSSILFQGAKGAAVISDTKSIIYALTNPDVSTPIHEIVHVYEKYLTPEEKAQILQATGETEWSVNTSEYFARGFERFLYDGEAPSEGLIGMFNKFREWLLEIYNSLVSSEIDVNLTPQVKDIYAAMLGEPRVEQKVEPAMAAPQTYTNELSTFIGERRSQGLSDDQIYQGLLEAGFKLEDLEPFFDTATRRTVESNLDPDSPFRAESVMMADEASGNYVKRTADELLKEVNSMSAEEQEAVLDSIAENSMMDVAVYKLIQDIITKQQNGEDITSDYERLVAIGTNLGRALQRFTELRKRSMSLRTESLIRKFEQDKKRTIPLAIKERLKTISTQFDKKKEEYEKARQLAGENASAISPIDSRYTNMELFKKLERELEGLAETYAKLSAPYVDKASYSKTAKTLIQGNLLTPNSGMVNIAANTIKSILNVPVNIISSIVSKFFPGTTSTYRGLGYYGAALKYGFMQGGRNAARIIRKGNIPETIQTLEIQNGFNGFRSLSQLLGSLLDAARGESSEEIATKYGYSLNQAGKIPKKEVAIKAWEGIVGLPAEMMFRFLGSADALFKNTAYFGALYEQAMIEVAAGRLDKSDVDNFIKLNSDFTNDVAKNEALRFVYANRTPVSKFIGGTLNIKSTDNVFVKAGKLAGSGVIPYVNVPTNIIAEYAQFMIPEYGGVMASVYTKQALDAKKKMDSAKNPQNKLKAEAEMLTNRRRAEEAAARAAVGLGLSMLIKTFVDSGAISASAQDEDEKRKDFIYRFERPYSINLSLLERARKGENDGFWRPGDAVRDYRFLGVVGGMMFISAKEARNAEKEKRKETATASLWNQLDNIPLPNIKETLQYVIEQSFLRGLNQMMQAFDPRQADRGGFERAATGLLTTLSAAILPNSFSIIDRMNRTYVPEFDSPYQGFEKVQYDFINKIKERWPFDDPNSLPAKVDPFGKRILQTPEDRNAFIYNTFDITKFTKALGGKGDITWEMLVMAAVKKGGDISAMPSNPSPEITPIAGPKYSMSQEEYQAYAIALGEARRRIVNGFIQGTDLKEFISPDSELNRQTGPDLNTPLGYYLLGKTLSKLYSAGDAVLFNEKRAIISEQRRKLAIERPKEFQALVEREKNSIYGEAISELYSDPELENYKQYLGNINLQAPSLENLEEIKFDFEKGKEILEMTEPNQGEEGVSGELTEFNKKWLESINKKKGIKK